MYNTNINTTYTFKIRSQFTQISLISKFSCWFENTSLENSSLIMQSSLIAEASGDLGYKIFHFILTLPMRNDNFLFQSESHRLYLYDKNLKLSAKHEPLHLNFTFNICLHTLLLPNAIHECITSTIRLIQTIY